MLGFGISVADYAKYFDGPWNNSFLPWLSLILKVAFDGYGGFYMMKTCLMQLKYSESVPWEKEFRVKGPYSGDKQKDDEKELKEIKDLEKTNGDDPSSWDDADKTKFQTSFQSKDITDSLDTVETA